MRMTSPGPACLEVRWAHLPPPLHFSSDTTTVLAVCVVGPLVYMTIRQIDSCSALGDIQPFSDSISKDMDSVQCWSSSNSCRHICHRPLAPIPTPLCPSSLVVSGRFPCEHSEETRPEEEAEPRPDVRDHRLRDMLMLLAQHHGLNHPFSAAGPPKDHS